MTKLRVPLTVPAAVTRIAGLIGFDGAARAVDRSESLVRKWSDDASDKRPGIDHAIALDAAYLAAGGEYAPILETYTQRLNHGVVATIASHLALAADLANAARESGEAIASGLAVQPGSGPREILRALTECEEAQLSMAVVVRRLLSFQARHDAGPQHGGVL